MDNEGAFLSTTKGTRMVGSLNLYNKKSQPSVDWLFNDFYFTQNA